MPVDEYMIYPIPNGLRVIKDGVPVGEYRMTPLQMVHFQAKTHEEWTRVIAETCRT